MKDEISLPYLESNSIRTFYPDVEDAELIWHVDFEDRIISILESKGWLLQMDECLPSPLVNGSEIFIEKLTWHRIIKGEGNLVVKITKLS